MTSVAIVGGGAVGLAYAAHLCRVADVLVIDRNPGTARSAAAGRLSVVLRRGEATEQLPVTFRVTDRWEPFDAEWVLVCVKTISTDAVARQLAVSWRSHTGLAISVQNGLGNRELLAQQLGTQRVRAGISHVAAKRLAPGIVEIGRAEVTIVERCGDDLAMIAIAGLMEAAGLVVRLDPDIDRLVWNKLIIAAGCNAIAALCRVPLGTFRDLRTSPLAPLVRSAMQECAAVMARKGIELRGDPVARLEEIASLSPHNHPSMLQDVLRGRPTEVDAINGAVVREGERLGIPVPTNTMLWRLIHVLEDTVDRRVPDITPQIGAEGR